MVRSLLGHSPVWLLAIWIYPSVMGAYNKVQYDFVISILLLTSSNSHSYVCWRRYRQEAYVLWQCSKLGAPPFVFLLSGCSMCPCFKWHLCFLSQCCIDFLCIALLPQNCPVSWNLGKCSVTRQLWLSQLNVLFNVCSGSTLLVVFKMLFAWDKHFGRSIWAGHNLICLTHWPVEVVVVWVLI